MVMLSLRNGLLRYGSAAFVAAAIVGAFDTAKTTANDRVPSSYVLGPDDLISIRVLQAPDLADKPIRIDLNGYIDLPFIGRVRAAGATVEVLRTELEAKFSAIVREPQVAINVDEFRSQPVSVIGAVNTPGVHQIRGKKSLVEVLSLADGLLMCRFSRDPLRPHRTTRST